MTLPNFLVIGAMKAGTTSLHAYLREHPQVFVPEKKEVDFFALDDNWAKGLAWYERHFDGVRDELVIGEVSPRYAFHPRFPGAPERIAETLGQPKLIYMLRHPIERIRSMYQHAIASGWDRRPISEALRDDPIYTDPSRYAMQLDLYLERTPRDRVLLVLAEDLLTERADTMRRIFQFLDVDAGWVPPNLNEVMHRGAEKEAPTAAGAVLARLARPLRSLVPPAARRIARRAVYRPIAPDETAITPDIEAMLLDRLLPDIARLRDEQRRDLGSDFDGWGLLPPI